MWVRYLFQHILIKHHPQSLTTKLIRSKFKGKSKFLILGSGSSINQVDVNDFSDKHTVSIGFNFWIYNRFIPDIYVFEIKPRETSRFIFWTELIKKRELELRNTIFIIKDSELDARLNEELISRYFPTSLRKNLMFSKDAPLIGKNLFRIMVIYMLRKITYPNAVIKYRGTLSFCLELLPRNSDVTLFGVDFDSMPHFWNAEDYIDIGLEKFQIPDSLGGKLHRTVDPRYGVTIDCFVKIRARLRKLYITHINPGNIDLSNT